MLNLRARNRRRMAVIGLCLGFFSVPAQANGLITINSQIAASLMLLTSGSSLCVTYAYDKNGNRTSEVTVGVPSSGAVWGSSPFGCFNWTNP